MDEESTFRDVLLDITDNFFDDKKSILLGNGFNLAGGFNDFDYKSIAQELLDKITSKRKLASVLDLALKEGNTDLEYYIKIISNLIESSIVLDRTEYRVQISGASIDELSIDLKWLREEILNIIKNIHINISPNDSFKLCAKNLTTFDYLFTLNYDLILYWLFLGANNAQKNKKFKDGFFNEKNSPLSEYSLTNHLQNVFFLHGAIHLLSTDTNDVIKVNRVNKNQRLVELIDKILKRIKEDDSLKIKLNNLIVLEGTSDQKQRQIFSSHYLTKCLKRLGRLEGCLVLYGCSILNPHSPEFNNDIHIWNLVFKSKLKKIYVGIHKEGEEYIALKGVINDLIKNHFDCPSKIFFFSTCKDSIWDIDF